MVINGENAGGPQEGMGERPDTPLDRYRGTVLPEWVDYNGHMNVAYYLVAFDLATDVFLEWIGLDKALRETRGGTTFTAEVHIGYLRELHEGDPIRVTTQLLSYDQKRIRYLHKMHHAENGLEAAYAENLSLYVDLNTRRVAEMAPPTLRRLEEVLAAHSELGRPDEAGRAIARPPVPGT
jgi:acyl-CoA thioester hydrolase